jgi:hypothetical protein
LSAANQKQAWPDFLFLSGHDFHGTPHGLPGLNRAGQVSRAVTKAQNNQGFSPC